MGASPSTHDVTDLDNTSKVYIKGLVDAGGNLDFPCIFTSEVIDGVDTAISAEASAIHEWCVEFPAPLSKRAYFAGEASHVFNECRCRCTCHRYNFTYSKFRDSLGRYYVINVI